MRIQMQTLLNLVHRSQLSIFCPHAQYPLAAYTLPILFYLNPLLYLFNIFIHKFLIFLN